MVKKYFTDEVLHESLQNSSDEEYPEDEEEENNEEVNVQIEEEIHDEIEARALQRKEDSEKDEVATASRTIQLFHLSLQCSGGLKHLLLKKENL
jgi:hypothetical protein